MSLRFLVSECRSGSSSAQLTISFVLSPPQWGCDLHSEHEQHLMDHCGKLPVFVTDYPAAVRPFYAKMNDGDDSDRQTVSSWVAAFMWPFVCIAKETLVLVATGGLSGPTSAWSRRGCRVQHEGGRLPGLEGEAGQVNIRMGRMACCQCGISEEMLKWVLFEELLQQCSCRSSVISFQVKLLNII